ncbi:hypothetical protein [Paenibacillus oralis]|uniref:hypothetical protein n=1 Tax=Paenibacillus oralis TaxID=2490856 RepID=UPI0015B0FE29|nr:hypothetical protein [Paenibacillus oralis]
MYQDRNYHANCTGKIKEEFSNAKVEYSIDYGDTKELGRMAREELQKLKEQHVLKK